MKRPNIISFASRAMCIGIVILTILATACKSGGKYVVYHYDNGDDYFCEGFQRIVDQNGKIGFRDSMGNIAISPQFAFAFPFKDGYAKVTESGHMEAVDKAGEYNRWVSDSWYYIDKVGKKHLELIEICGTVGFSDNSLKIGSFAETLFMTTCSAKATDLNVDVASPEEFQPKLVDDLSTEMPIPLVQPSQTGGLTIMETLWNRHSDRTFSEKMLSDQDLSDLLFAASGVNRVEEGRLTSPSALNTQEIDLYLFTKDGVFKYIPNGHRLQKVVDGDKRSLIAGTPEFSQDFVLEAPVSLLTVANSQKFDRLSEMANMMAVADAGIMSENVCMFCAGRGLSVVPRATMNRDAISQLLNLPKEAILVLNLPVGYPE